MLTIRILATVFAALLGLAFGSFLNVCLSRWPEGESIVKPRSHCRSCGRALAWWENVPLASWLALRGRCRTCNAWIGWRYPLVELAMGWLWGFSIWKFLTPAFDSNLPAISPFLHWNLYNEIGQTIALLIFFWTLIAIAALDAEYLWVPDWLTLPGIVLGIASTTTYEIIAQEYSDAPPQSAASVALRFVLTRLAGVAISALLILIIYWVYKLIRKREGIGLGDAKLMAMLAAWLGLEGALLSFFIGVALGSVAAIVAIAQHSKNKNNEGWAVMKLPLGTFLCVGGIISTLWGQPIIHAYLHWAGF